MNTKHKKWMITTPSIPVLAVATAFAAQDNQSQRDSAAKPANPSEEKWYDSSNWYGNSQNAEEGRIFGTRGIQGPSTDTKNESSNSKDSDSSHSSSPKPFGSQSDDREMTGSDRDENADWAFWEEDRWEEDYESAASSDETSTQRKDGEYAWNDSNNKWEKQSENYDRRPSAQSDKDHSASTSDMDRSTNTSDKDRSYGTSNKDRGSSTTDMNRGSIASNNTERDNTPNYGAISSNQSWNKDQESNQSSSGYDRQGGNIHGDQTAMADEKNKRGHDSQSVSPNPFSDDQRSTEASQQKDLSGEIVAFRKMELRPQGNSASTEEYIITKMKLDGGEHIVVSLGEKTDLDKLNLEKGDSVELTGVRGHVSGEPVFIAKKLEIGNKTIDVNRAIIVSESEMGSQTASLSGLRNSEKSGSETYGAQDQNRYGSDKQARLDGTIKSIQTKSDTKSGEYSMTETAELKLENGKTKTVAINSGNSFEDLNLSKGDKVRIVGQNMKIDGKSVLFIEKLWINGEKADEIS